MCGIAGELRFDSTTPVRATIARLCRLLEHRGPDAEGVLIAGPVALVQRRLAVIDLNPSATAPLANEDGTVHVTLNGEIYNHRELRETLRRHGHAFRTASDTEVVVHAYEQWGAGCVHRLDGMFALAIWDGRTQTLFAARDRLGKKPFVYAHNSSTLVFASEIRALVAHPEVSRSPDYAAIDAYLTAQCVPSPMTGFAAVRKLPPGHTLTCDVSGRLVLQRYWEPPVAAAEETSPGEWEDRILDALRRAVRRRLVADVPVGAFLSGGIDSGLIVALMAEASPLPVRTFTMGMEGEDPSRSELPCARLVAERFGTDHHEEIIRPAAAEVLPELIEHYGEPFADASAVPTYYVSKLARRDVTVALSGDGGDESFGGYTAYGAVHRWRLADAIPQSLRRSVANSGLRVTRMFGSGTLAPRVERGLAMLAGSLEDRYRLHMALLKPQEKELCYSRAFRADVGRVHPWDADAGAPNGDQLAWMLRHDQLHYLPDCLLVKVDIASMMNSLEVRSPFLDHHVVELAARVPSRLKRAGGEGKLVLKRAARRLLPPELLRKPKTGFGVPVAEWLRSELQPLVREHLTDSTFDRRSLFNAGAVAAMVDQHMNRERDWSNRLWAFLMLEMWFRRCVD